MEYMFRGFDAVGNKGWVYGDLVHNQKVTKDGLEPRVMVGGYEVVPESVGLWTSLKDKKGNEIYDGDIVMWDRDQKMYVVVFRNGMFYASVEECNPHIYGGFPLWCLCEEEQHCAIVGNIFDNKKLLKHG
jgi:hypothetical protein